MGFLEQLGEAGIGRTDKEGAAGFDYLLKGIDSIGQRYEQNAMQDMQTRATQSAMRLFSDGVTFEKMDEFQRMFPQINPMTSFKLADEVAQRFETIKMESLGPKLMQGLQDKSIDPNRPESIAKWANQEGLTTSQAGKVVKMVSDFKTVNPEWKWGKDERGDYQESERTGKREYVPDKKEGMVWVHRVAPDDRVIEHEIPKSQVPGAVDAGWAIGKSTAKPRPLSEKEPRQPDMKKLYFPDGRKMEAREGTPRYQQAISEGASDIEPASDNKKKLDSYKKVYLSFKGRKENILGGAPDLIAPEKKEGLVKELDAQMQVIFKAFIDGGGDPAELGEQTPPKASAAPAAITDTLKSSRGAAVPGESVAASQFVMGKKYTNPKTGQVGIWNGKEMVPVK